MLAEHTLTELFAQSSECFWYKSEICNKLIFLLCSFLHLFPTIQRRGVLPNATLTDNACIKRAQELIILAVLAS